MPEVTAPAPEQQAQQPGGQWVYTDQYGWVWMPYGQQYTYSPPPEVAYPYSYVYYPVYGWVWLYSPWVWGWGPRPYFGFYGPSHFVWYHGPGFYRAPGPYFAYRGWGPHVHGFYRGGFGTHGYGFG
ncbi:MAG TPA: hypothetical protein VKE49_11825, partial [Myxococcaceae bacterium]|nr:hypothetical protein [Myxococcaceae bacterium]